MNRKPYLSLLLAVLLAGGMLALFPTVWMLLVIALLALVTAQAVLVRRSLHRLPAGMLHAPDPVGTVMQPAQAEPAAAAAADDSPASESPTAAAAQYTAAAKPAAKPAARRTAKASPASPATAAADGPSGAERPAPPAQGAPRADIDPTVFSQFRRHLEQAEAGDDGAAPDDTAPAANPAPAVNSAPAANPAPTPKPAPAASPASAAKPTSATYAAPTGGATPAAPSPPAAVDADADVEDRVELSGAARRPPPPAATATTNAANATASATPPARAAARRRARATPEPPAQPDPAPAPEPAEAAGAEGDAEGDSADLFADLRPVPPGLETDPGPEVAEGDDVGAALAGAQRDRPALVDEASALLRMAEEAASLGDWEGLRGGLYNYRAHLAELPALVSGRARRLQVRLGVHDGEPDDALQAFEELLQMGPRPALEAVPSLLDELLGAAEPSAAAALRVSMLVRILGGLRQARDQQAMDRCYGWIEEAQEQVGDERRLLQYLKNHLEIRRVLGDVPGQLELIDQLGNRCYRLGLTDEAKTYYEMGLRLRGDGKDVPPPPSAADGAAGES